VITPVHYGLMLPRWIRLAMPEDVKQEIALAKLLGRTEAQRREALKFRLRELRRTQWERRPCKPAHQPAALRPSKLAEITGYRTDPARHQIARMTINPEIRREIARKGQAAWKANR
jgi:hypothetical protein